MSVKMGSKRNEAETVQPKEQAQETKASSRKSTARKSTAPAVEVKERPATKRRLGGDRPSGGLWYMQDTVDLEGVTSDSSNPSIGLLEMKVYEPSEKQWENGVLATITLETVIGQIKAIQVLESPRDSSIYVRAQSRSYENDKGKQYVNDVTLDRKIQAQILRHVEGMLVDA